MNNTGKYIDYKIECVIFYPTSGFKGLIYTVASQISVDTTDGMSMCS